MLDTNITLCTLTEKTDSGKKHKNKPDIKHMSNRCLAHTPSSGVLPIAACHFFLLKFGIGIVVPSAAAWQSGMQHWPCQST